MFKELIQNEINPLLIGLRSEVEHLGKIFEQGQSVPVGFTFTKEAIQEMKHHDGKTPVKGVDYFTEKEADEFLARATPKVGTDYFTAKDIESFKKAVTPVKGTDYTDGYTPVKGTDYFTDEEVKAFLQKVTPIKGVHYTDGARGPRGEKGADGTAISAEDIRRKLESLKGSSRLSIKAIKGWEDAVNEHLLEKGFGHTAAPQDGGIGGSGGAGTSSTINGLISAGTNVTITGTGTQADPYVINATGGGGGAVSSIFGRTGAVVATAGDYNTSQVTESGNLYFTNARAQSAMSGLYELPLTFSTGLTRSTNTITANLSTGVSGGQSVVGGTAAGDGLTLSSTSNATKGSIVFGTSSYNESVNTLGIGTTASTTNKITFADTVLAGSGALTGSLVNMTQTWNTSGSPTAIKLNVTNTASGATARLIDLQVGGFSQFYVDKAGNTFGTSLDVTGTGGAGYLELTEQSAKPSTPTNATRLYSDSSNRLSWIGENGYVRTFDGTANTADRVYTLPNLNGTLKLGGSEALTSDASTSNTTATDTNLAFFMEANTTYTIIISGTAAKATTTTGLKVELGVPTGATVKGQQQQGTAAVSTAMTNSIITAGNTLGSTFATGAGVEVPFRIEATITTGGTSGNFVFRFATVTSNTATIYAGTRLTWTVASLV